MHVDVSLELVSESLGLRQLAPERFLNNDSPLPPASLNLRL